MFDFLKWPSRQKSSVESKPPHSDLDLGIHSRPSFDVILSPSAAMAMFARLQNSFKKLWQEGRRHSISPPFQLELGSLPHRRRYFFVAPWNGPGWLIESTPIGWAISGAEKIVQQNKFMRSATPIDSVTLFQERQNPKACMRLHSSLFGPDLMTYPVYQSELVRLLNLERSE